MNLHLEKFIKLMIAATLILSTQAFAALKDHTLPKGTLLAIAPPVVNKDYFLFEFGFVTEKKIRDWNYPYNAFVTAGLYQDSKGLDNKLKAGALGFKAGVMLPTQPWIPLLFTSSLGYSKTVLHKNPFLGRDTQSANKKDMFLVEAGVLYHYERYFLRFAYQLGTVKYFKRHTFFAIGVDY